MSQRAAPRVPRRAWLTGALRTGAAFALPVEPALASSSSTAVGGAPAPPRVNVSLNESAFGPSPRVIQALRAELHGLERYTDGEARELTRQIAQFEQVPVEQIVLGEVLEPLGLQLGLQGGPGGEFLYSEPGYTALVDAARPVGGISVPIPLNARLENDLPSFLAKLNARTRAAFLVNPHNPSGTISDPVELEATVSALAKKTLVVVDEAYLDYLDDFATRTLVGRVRAGENVIVFRTFSKLHGLAALPLGYAVAPRQLADSLRASGLGSARSLNRLAVRAADASLSDAGYLATIRSKVKSERARFHEVLAQLRLRHSESSASFVFFESSRPQAGLKAALAAEGIDVGRAFPPLLNWTRISIGLPAENRRVQAALRRIFA